MNRRALVGVALAAVALALGAGAATLALAKSDKPKPSLGGEWRLDASRSESPQTVRPAAREHGDMGGDMGSGPPGGMGGMGGGPPGGGMGGMGGGPPGGGMGGGPPGGGEEGGGAQGQRPDAQSDKAPEQPPHALPDRLRIEQSDAMVLLEDSTGTALQAIALGDAAASLSEQAPQALQLSGRWKKDKLEVERSTSRGTKIKETYKLTDKGQTLVVETKIEASDPLPSIKFKRVYQKVASR